MHIAEGFLPPVHAAAWTAAAAPFVVAGFRTVRTRLEERPEDKVVVASSGAFAFVLSALKIPSVSGSTSHPTGVGLGTCVFGPSVMAALGSLVLVFQALLLAHGGVTTLGANTFAMAVAGPWVTWWVLCTLRRTGVAFSTAGGVAAALGNLAAYATTALQLALAHPDPSSGVAGAAATFLGIFAVTQIPLAVIEGVLTALVLRWLATRSNVEVLGARRERPLGPAYVAAVLTAVVVLITAPVVARQGGEWAGADSIATERVLVEDPDYDPWFGGWWAPPSGEIESFLFALQAAGGAAVIGYVVGSRRRRVDVPRERTR